MRKLEIGARRNLLVVVFDEVCAGHNLSRNVQRDFGDEV